MLMILSIHFHKNMGERKMGEGNRYYISQQDKMCIHYDKMLTSNSLKSWH